MIDYRAKAEKVQMSLEQLVWIRGAVQRTMEICQGLKSQLEGAPYSQVCDHLNVIDNKDSNVL